MQKSFQTILWVIVFGLAFGNIYAQLKSNDRQTSLPYAPKSYFMNPEAECTGAGELIYDDGTFENGYGWNPSVTDGRFLMLATPLEYPWQFNTFCIALTKNGASTAFTFDIIVYDNSGAGGTPGTIIATVPGVTATGVPTWPVLAFYDFDISSVQALAGGSYYVGIMFNPVVQVGFFIGADESIATPLWPSYASPDGGVTWTTNQTYWAGYKAMGIRTLGSSGPPCPVEPATNPSPVNGATNVSINPGDATWTNGAGADSLEVFFGPAGNMISVYSGGLITTLSIPAPLDYATDYEWKVVCWNDTCSAYTSTWSFTTEQDPLLVIDTALVYPQGISYWTGTTDGASKTQVSLVNGWNLEDGWMKFDISSIPTGSTVNSVIFHGYVNATIWPYWSVTPMALDPVTATAPDIYAAITAGEGSGIAYLFSDEGGGYTTGWKTYPLGGTVNADLSAALTGGWFAVGISSRDNSASYYINFDGWAETNVPYLEVEYQYIIPVELTSFSAATDNRNVTLNWSTATELNNSGFQVERSSGIEYQLVGFIAGHGTTTEIQNYSYVDQNVVGGKYSYRLKQIDFDGTFEYSNVVEVEVLGVKEYALGQNYPNPFNPSTTINFSLAVDSKVSLKIFDVLGQEVATLVNGQLTAGSQRVSFDASSLNSGVYFYRIDADGIDGQKFSSVKKMILTK